MTRQTPVPRKPALKLVPDFTPVPLRYRFDGWTPERQRIFIQTLADTGSVKRAAARANMSVEGAYALRNHPQAASFRAAWDAAKTLGRERIDDIGMELAIEGEMIPVFCDGKLAGYRHKHNDKLIRYYLHLHHGTYRGYGARPQTLVSTVQASAAGGVELGADGAVSAHASASTAHMMIAGGAGAGSHAAASRAMELEEAAQVIGAFQGVALDEQAQAEMQKILEACAERCRLTDEAVAEGGANGALAQLDARTNDFVPTDSDLIYDNRLPGLEPSEPPRPDDAHWSLAGAEVPEDHADFYRELRDQGKDPATMRVVFPEGEGKPSKTEGQ